MTVFQHPAKAAVRPVHRIVQNPGAQNPPHARLQRREFLPQANNDPDHAATDMLPSLNLKKRITDFTNPLL